MRPLFVDTGFLIAMVNPRDPFHLRSLEMYPDLAKCRLHTSIPVLGEFLDYCCGYSLTIKTAALGLVRTARTYWEVTEWSMSLFDDALALYGEYGDKRWSLVDCSSFVIMRRQRITDALAADRHFAQAGFVPLLATAR